MYLRQLRVQNLKLLRDVKIPFLRDDRPRMWTVLLGENGLCKTTVLQAITYAAAGVNLANKLGEIDSLFDRRLEGCEVGIRADFEFGSHNHSKRIYPGLTLASDDRPRIASTLTLQPGWKVFNGTSAYDTSLGTKAGIDPLSEARGRALPHWFVAAYGVQRMLPTPQSGNGYSNAVYERMATLFNQGRIIGTSFADLFEQTDRVQLFSKQLQKALIRGKHLLPRVTGLELRGQGGVRTATDLVESHRFTIEAGAQTVKIPATWLSQGYQGMIAWIADLIGQQFWDMEKPIDIAKMEGLVLIDELDLFLHPTWQVSLIQTLKATFPRMQFVVTTHSPMVIAGCERDEVFTMKQDADGNIQVRQATQEPRLMSGSELYKAFFGVENLYANEAGGLLQEYSFLASNSERTEEENIRVAELLEKLKDQGIAPDWKPVKRRKK